MAEPGKTSSLYDWGNLIYLLHSAFAATSPLLAASALANLSSQFRAASFKFFSISFTLISTCVDLTLTM